MFEKQAGISYNIPPKPETLITNDHSTNKQGGGGGRVSEELGYYPRVDLGCAMGGRGKHGGSNYWLLTVTGGREPTYTMT